MGRALNAPIRKLDAPGLTRGVAALSDADPRIRALFQRNGTPPLWARDEGFATLVKIILEQQVSLASAAAAFAKLETALGTVTPEGFLQLDDAELKRIGFSRQKAGYCRGLSAALLDGSLPLAILSSWSDEEARHALLAIRGLGPWTADVYLLFALQRPDVWPLGDRALVVSMAENLELGSVPSYEEAAAFAEIWAPWRAVAARMLWHAYLVNRGRSLE